MSKIHDLVFRAADQLYASETALDQSKADRHRLLADELIKLIRVEGSEAAYLDLRQREESRSGIENPVPIADVLGAARPFADRGKPENAQGLVMSSAVRTG